ncbi:hypothetical protein Y032_0076g1046 [Ancylostoma ceylanicum]|uniref:Uncharacterized protein n=1 Tax=Ancylostoma ceylanicum TaxID=53326 RepID=A0A016TVK9_9BILA|nr:hypothetical protein Y032_0076g1046 [Ancylostoma ceylanicum]
MSGELESRDGCLNHHCEHHHCAGEEGSVVYPNKVEILCDFIADICNKSVHIPICRLLAVFGCDTITLSRFSDLKQDQGRMPPFVPSG